MHACWRTIPVFRPTAKMVKEKLQEILTDPTLVCNSCTCQLLYQFCHQEYLNSLDSDLLMRLVESYFQMIEQIFKFNANMIYTNSAKDLA